jgi:hypothetical protein
VRGLRKVGDRKDDLVLLYQSGLSVHEVGRRLGVNGQTVHNALVTLGIPRREPGEWKRGVPHAPEHARKISEAGRGKKRPGAGPAVCPAAGWNTGKRKSVNPEMATTGMPGERHWNWKGGISSETARLRQSAEYKVWRDAVFARDRYTCRNCGKRGGALNADHIKTFSRHPDLRFDVSNGQTLCVPCHLEKTKEDRRVWTR